MGAGGLKLVFAGFLLVFSGFLVSGGDTATVSFEADVQGLPLPMVSIVAPDSVFFGNVSVGEEVRTSDKIRINNTGNVAVRVTTQLVNSSDDIFSNLYFSLLATGNRTNVEGFSFTIDAPTKTTPVKYEDFYGWLDLQNYTGSIARGSSIRRSADVRFIAVEN